MRHTKDTDKSQTKPRFFYGYTIVATSVLILIVMHGIGSSFGVFFSPLQTEFGWSRATISGAAAIGMLMGGMFSIVTGMITDRFGPKVTITVSAFVLTIGYLLMSRMQSIWQLYLIFGVFLALGNTGGDIALLPTVARWFATRRSLMNSIVKSGTGTGMLVMPLVSAWLIVSYNWRTAYVVLAILALVAIVGFSRLLKRDPAEMGLRPYGEAEAAAANLGKLQINFVLREVLRTPQFWLLSGTYSLLSYATASVVTHIVPHAVDVGLSVGQAAGVASAIGGVSILGRLTMGSAGDRIGNRKALIVCFGVLIAALTWLQFAAQPWMIYIFAAVYGFAHGGFFAIMSPLVAELFGLKSLASNLGVLFFVGTIGGAIGPIITGRLFDVANTYQTAFVIMLGMAASGLVLALFIKPVKHT